MPQTLFASFIGLSLWLLHPFHTSITNCEYNAQSQGLEISIRVFTEDLELAIGEPIQNIKPTASIEQDSAIVTYLKNHIAFKADKLELKTIYLGRETEYDITYLYMEIPTFPHTAKKFEIRQTILFDQFEDQSNILHLQLGEESKSLFYVAGETFKTVLFP